jgi:hypothetical protein
MPSLTRRSKTARIYVDRLLPWLEAHRDVPFFVLHHDPHDFTGRSPYDTLPADPGGREEHERGRRRSELRLAPVESTGMPTAGLGQGRLRRRRLRDLIPRLVRRSIEPGRRDRPAGRAPAELGLTARPPRLTSDHGEEPSATGRTFHGQGLGKLGNLSPIFLGPATSRQEASSTARSRPRHHADAAQRPAIRSCRRRRRVLAFCRCSPPAAAASWATRAARGGWPNRPRHHGKGRHQRADGGAAAPGYRADPIIAGASS